MNRITERLHHLGHQFCTILKLVVGHLSWQPPQWLSQTGAAARQRPRIWITIGGIALGILVLAGLLGAWCARSPKEDKVVVSIVPPKISPVIDGKIIPQGLILNFSQSAALLDQINKKVLRGLELHPPLPGTWTWTTDRQLSFEPTQDWQPGTDYTIALHSSLFPGHIKLATYRPKFTTPAFKAQIESPEFYVNPKDPDTKQVVAVLRFTHPVDEKELARLVNIKSYGKENLFQAADRDKPPFTLIMGPANRSATLRTLPLKLPESETFLKITLAKGLHDATGNAVFNGRLDSDVRIPNLYSGLRFNTATTSIAIRRDGEPEQVLILESTLGIKPEMLRKSASIYLLPRDKPAEGKVKEVKNYEWTSLLDITNTLLASSQTLSTTFNPTEEPFPKTNSLKINAPENRYLYIKIHRGLTGLGGYVLGDNFHTLVKVAPYPKELRILHDGAILALSGERKLSVLARSLNLIEYRIGRIAPKEINHLISQSSGNFQSPVFDSYSFGEDNLCDVLSKTVTVNAAPGQASYTSLDFNDYLTDKRTGDHRGLFIVRIAEGQKKTNPEESDSTEAESENQDSNRWSDRDQQNDGGPSDRRLILITDLGIIAKQNADSSQEVFVQSIKTGKPVSEASVEVLGKNGLPVASTSTDRDGRASIPVLKDFKREQTPVAIVVRRGEDLSFMPYGRADRRLNYSRYDISGLEIAHPDGLDAFVFSDRGIYRPGESAHIAIALKQMDWKGNLTGLPLEIAVTDPRGQISTTNRISTPRGGFMEWNFTTQDASPTGTYNIGVYLVNKDQRGELLGETNIRVEEFLPDRMKIKATLTGEPSKGWVHPENLKIQVDLQNLYGAPAAGHRIAGKISLTPAALAFPSYADYSFFDPLLKETVRREAHEEDLAEGSTDDSGKSLLDPNLTRFDQSAYRLTYLARGYEKEGGRSVATGGESLVSSRPWLIGYKPDGDLKYITRNSKRQVEYLAIDPQLKPFAAGELKLVIAEQFYVSVLTKKENGNYAYQSVLKEREVKTETLHLQSSPLAWTVPTTEAGDYIARLYNAENLCVSVIRFNVVGTGNLTRQLDRNAELKARLAKVEFQPGEEIAISITAPYIGSGLITIESDRVYAHAWFSAKSLGSVQKITIPKDFEGNGYLNVAFVRALDSHEIFMSPLSYAVIPFRVNRDKRTVKVELSTPEKAIPGESLAIRYQSSRPAKVIVYAVDEGILQVAGYELPSPLDHFMQKRALQVTTDQILDLILPEYSISREVAAAGGDGREDLLAANLNPFKRKGEAPVVFWSGIVDCDAQPRVATYRVPDYFNGTLRVMAVAVSDSAVGSAERKVKSCGPFVIQPNTPTFVAPGDVFDVSVTVANNVEGSGQQAQVEFNVASSDSLEIVQRPARAVTIAEGRDTTLHLLCRAKDILGNADLDFTVSRNAESAHYSAHLSIRPPVAYRTEIKSGSFARKNQTISLSRTLYPAYHKGAASVSMMPLGLCKGLQTYLDDYPHLCSEQITSKGLPTIVLAGETELGVSKKEAAETMRTICTILRSRQNDQGGFGLWRADQVSAFNFTSVYVMQFLTEAKDLEYPVMDDMFQSGLKYLTQMAGETPKSLWQARNQALAIYLLTRNGIVATNYLDRLRDHLEKDYAATWRNDLAAVYCAGAYSQLRNQSEGEKLLTEFKMGAPSSLAPYDFYSELGRDSQYLAILSRHFPEQLRRISVDELQTIVNAIIEGNYNTHSAAYAILGLHAYSQALSSAGLKIEYSRTDGNFQPMATTGTIVPAGTFDVNTKAVRFERSNDTGLTKQSPVFYQITQSGFDRTTPDKVISEGLEIQREYRNAKGETVDRVALGEELEVHLKVRSTGRDFVENTAIVDLLPGGFEVVMESVRDAESGIARSGQALRWETITVDYVDLREDRIVAYGTVYRSVREFVYRIKAVNKGHYTVPPAQVESMYNRRLQARSLGGHMQVEGK